MAVKYLLISLPQGIVSRNVKERLTPLHLPPQLRIVQIPWNNLYIQILQIIQATGGTDKGFHGIPLLHQQPEQIRTDKPRASRNKNPIEF
jgi:hypothetical protein